MPSYTVYRRHGDSAQVSNGVASPVGEYYAESPEAAINKAVQLMPDHLLREAFYTVQTDAISEYFYVEVQRSYDRTVEVRKSPIRE